MSGAAGETARDEQGPHGSVVAAHYNTLEEKGLRERFNSPIIYLRNFNNWVKSTLIGSYTDELRRRDYGRALRALDVCCGKGGDLNKWHKAKIRHLVCADIAAVSVTQCEARYSDLRGHQLFTAEFITADCTKERLREKYKDPSIQLDIASCQFGFHYCFESLPQAETMLKNVSECLRPGGFFIGTMPDAYEIISRCKKGNGKSFGNSIFNIKLMFDPEKEGYPLFGAKYDFHLEGVVDCPEFLVNFEVLTKLAAKFGLELVLKEKFDEFFKRNRESYGHLFSRIRCFESYPPHGGSSLVAPETEYRHAKEHLAEHDKAIYLAFAFKKCKSTLDADGKPVFETTTGQKNETSKP